MDVIGEHWGALQHRQAVVVPLALECGEGLLRL